jgi:hypothetical protein
MVFNCLKKGLLSFVVGIQILTSANAITLKGHNGTEVEFSGLAYATREGVFARQSRGNEMLVKWELLHPDMYKAEGAPLRQAYLFLEATETVYLGWGFYAKAELDDKTRPHISNVIQCAADQYAYIIDSEYARYGIAFVCTTNGIDFLAHLRGPVDPFATPVNSSDKNSLTSKILEKKLEERGISGSPAGHIDLGQFKVFLYFREAPTTIYGLDPIGNPLFEKKSTVNGPVDPFKTPQLKSIAVKSDVRIFSCIDKIEIDYLEDKQTKTQSIELSSDIRNAVYAFQFFIDSKGLSPDFKKVESVFIDPTF